MQWLRCLLLFLPLVGTARAEDIVDVLRRSQQLRLEQQSTADPDGPRAETVRRTFTALVAAAPGLPPVDLHVIRGPVLAETVHGHIVLANESLADLPEGERFFVLAHELGHVMQHHWLQMALVYQKWIPGEVSPELADAVADRLGRDASALAHRQEFEADAFALQLLQRTGQDPALAIRAFMRLGPTPDTATHPGTRKRVASLRAALAGSE
ncbi:M48 family metalloprotease [Piscinibacter defluvii]|uniref:M48 family metalloprotease n=1 Tax=Piscinibacter defluvii TaxID=1796922 RepID=UPI000FDD2D2C|nr:M48 family metalloprotease [Piscinibacter defluvii]